MKRKNKKIKLNLSSVITALKKINEIRKEYIRVLFINAVLQAARPFIPIILSARILDELLGDRNTTTLLTLALILVGLMLVTHVLQGYFTKRYNDETMLLTNNYYFELSKKSMKLDYEQIEKKETLDLLQFIQEAGNNYMGIWHIAEYLQKGLLAILEIIIATSLIMTMFTNNVNTLVDENLSFIQSPITFIILGLLLLTGIIIISIIQGKLGKIAADDVKSGVGSNRIFGYLFFHVSYNYENGKDIRLYSAQNMLNEKIRNFVEPNCQVSVDNFIKPNAKYLSLLNLVNVIMLVAVYMFITLKAYIGAITVGAIFIQINAIMKLYQSIGSSLKQYNMLKAACEHFKNSIQYFDLPEMKKIGTKKVNLDDELIFEFKNVSFMYPSTDTLVLDNINLTINSGERLAVVGMNGAGKTTMIKLLCRLYDPTEGIITLNGIDIRQYDFDDYIKLFSVVFQDFRLFSFNVDQNVASSETVDQNKLEECLNNSGLGNIAEELNGDYQVSVGKNFDEDGRDFSGGEKQKLAIARALYKDAPIVVLDEPTAALDPIAEFEIYSKFNKLVGDKAAVFISHRLSSCKFCHNIAVFDNGHIVQFGSHDSLLSNSEGKYYELWNVQAEHYIYD
ncbi:ABC transporter ATP-binding protein [Mycoplasmatota bacterium]|nr:ABC transporter ATP-binding protein [Mycoplasmatota bacterium]